MNIFFLSLSCIYVAVIFLMAGSSVVSEISVLNPYSLLHIPLYGILTFLLYFSFSPIKFRSLFPRKGPMTHDQLPMTGNPTQRFFDAKTQRRNGAATVLRPSDAMPRLLPGLIAVFIGIADEFHQSFIPSRDASFADVLLDIAGIVLALFLIRQWMNWLKVRG